MLHHTRANTNHDPHCILHRTGYRTFARRCLCCSPNTIRTSSSACPEKGRPRSAWLRDYLRIAVPVCCVVLRTLCVAGSESKRVLI